ncbi:MAG: hypothetical protein AAGG48_17520 [Planctomycetota bacterium]
MKRSNELAMWFGKLDSKQKSRVIVGSVVALLIVGHLVTSVYGALSASQQRMVHGSTAQERTPSVHRAPMETNAASKQNPPQESPAEAVLRADHEATEDGASLLAAITKTEPKVPAPQPAAMSMEGTEAKPIPPVNLDQVSYVGYYEWQFRRSVYARERVELRFKRFDLERRAVEVELVSLDHREWGSPRFAGIFKPDSTGGGEIVLQKKRGGERHDPNYIDVFSPHLENWGTPAQLTLMVEGEAIHGSSNSGEQLILSRVERNRIERRWVPDPEKVLGEPAEKEMTPSGEDGAPSSEDAPQEGLEGTWQLVKWNDKRCPRDVEHLWTFEGGRFTWTENGMTRQSGILRTYERGKPHPMINLGISGSRASYGIYRISGDQLFACFSAPGRPRPNTLSRRASGHSAVFELQRVSETDTSSDSLASH